MIVKLKISDIVIPQGLLPRVLTGTVAEVVERYREAYEVGENLPPIKVWKRENGYWLIDGVHRLQAHKLLGREYIEAELVECKDELDFRIKAIQENIKHGLSLSAEEIKENARLLYRAGLKDVEELARILRRSRSSVYAYVQDLIEEEKQALRRQVLELRKQGLTQEQIAKELGIDRSTVSKMCKIPETGKFHIPLSLPPTEEEALQTPPSSPTSPPSSGLAGSQPALSMQVSDDDWADWNDDDEVQERVQEKKQEKKEVKLVPPEEELERLAGDIYRIVAIVMERYPEVVEEWWEEIEKEVREAIEIRRKREGK